MTLSRVMCVITTIFLMVRYSVLALCIQRTNDRRGSRQLTSFSLAMGFRGPNLLRAAVTGERPETLPSAKVSKWREAANVAAAQCPVLLWSGEKFAAPERRRSELEHDHSALLV
jgi:hypothetical protein